MEAEKYLDFCETDRQREIAEAVIRYGVMEASRRLNVSHTTVSISWKRTKARAARQGFSPEHDFKKQVPMGFHVKGTSTLYDEDGNPKMQWVKSSIDRETQERLAKEFIDSFLQDTPPLPKIPQQKINNRSKDVIPWFQIGDAHIGMLAHEAEVGHNFDLKIAEQELVKAMQELILRSRDCERCVIQDLGDATHYENFSATTEASGHALDADGRFPKMIKVYARIMRAIIDAALVKFKYVDVIINQGNHSRTNDIWMAIFLRNVYENNKRLTVLDNSSVYIPYRMGNTFVMCHHGDKGKGTKLVQVMKTDFRHDFGEAKYKYIDCGHIHTSTKNEHGDVTIETWNQLAPSDKYAHDGGWRSRSCLTAVYRSKTYGEVGREKITAEEVKDMLKGLPPGSSAEERRDVYSV